MDDQSWGWDIRLNKLHHNGIYYKYHTCEFIPEEIYVILDSDQGTLAFAINDKKYLGVAKV